MSFGQCFICRGWSGEAQERNGTMGVRFCMECWNDQVQEMHRKYELGRGKAERDVQSSRERPGRSVPLLDLPTDV